MAVLKAEAFPQEALSVFRRYEVVPLGEDMGVLHVGSAKGVSPEGVDFMGFLLERRVVVEVIGMSRYLEEEDRFYGSGVEEEEVLGEPGKVFVTGGELDEILGAAEAGSVSDIHMESEEGGMRVRFRRDGEMEGYGRFGVSEARALVMQVKVRAGMNIDDDVSPQDGRLFTREPSREYRISYLPSALGPSLVLRVFNDTQVGLDFGGLGMSEDVERVLREVLESESGLFLVTGPTGSGKTTTLYAMLEYLKGRRKVLSVEDPVERLVDGVNQIPVKRAHGMTFGGTLRNVLRHAPDVIMVGEIRDAQTAKIAVEASATGHLVLASLHCSAGEERSRLEYLGVSAKRLGHTLLGSLAQELVRSDEGGRRSGKFVINR